MPNVALNALVPDFALKNFEGETIHVSDFHQRFNVLIVLNRGFT